MIIRPLTVAVFLLAACVLCSCGVTQDAVRTPQLPGTEWTATELYDSRVLVPPGGGAPTLLFGPEDGAAYGTTGCNRFTVGYTLAQDRVNFGQAATTRMACPEPLDENERKFLRALEEANRARVVGSTLELLSGSTVIARFRAGVAVAG